MPCEPTEPIDAIERRRRLAALVFLALDWRLLAAHPRQTLMKSATSSAGTREYALEIYVTDRSVPDRSVAH